MVDGHAAGDGQAHELGRADDVEGGAARNLAGVIAPAGELDQTDVALKHDGLGGGRDAAQAKPGRDLALVHHAILGQRGILEVMHDQRAEILGVGEHVAHDLGVGEARLAVGEGNGARPR